MRSRHSLNRAIRVAAIAVILLLPFGGLAQTQQTGIEKETGPQAPKEQQIRQRPAGVQQITLAQAQALAVDALRREEPVLAYRLAEGLLQANQQSSFAHFTLAQAHQQMGQIAEGRRAAARAFRFADNRLHRFEAARLAAGLAYSEKRPTLAQLWVRRAAQNAPNAETEAQLGRDFARLRSENPFSFSVQGGLRPSSNVNNGSDMAVQVIDGLPFVGTLSGSARALSGTVGHLDTRLSYRLDQSKRHQTSVTARLYVRRVTLSSSAKALAPDARNSDFASSFAEAGLSHRWALGDTGETANVGFSIGQYWSAGNRNYHFGRLETGRDWRLGPRTRLTLDGSFEMRASARSSFFDRQVFQAVAGLQHRLEGGDQFNLSLNLRKTRSDFFNARAQAATLRMSYALGKQIGPIKVSAGLTLGYSDYPDFAVLFAVPGGRQDRSLYADVNFFFPDMDYAGFAPSLRISAGRTESNVSRYETRQFAVSLGIRSKF